MKIIFERIVKSVLQRYWRWQRGLTLGARGIVIDPRDRILLVRQTYMSGWVFPGGGVEYGETIEESLSRELVEEANVVMVGSPELFGIYSNWHLYRGDHVAIYVIRAWTQSHMPEPNREIAEIGFFPRGALPEGTTPGTRRRLAELFDGAPRTQLW